MSSNFLQGENKKKEIVLVYGQEMFVKTSNILFNA